MARVSPRNQPITELYLIQGEVPDTQDLDDARQWVTIYRELVTFADRTLTRLRREAGSNGDADRLDTSDADERGMDGHLRRLQSRLDFWERWMPPSSTTPIPATSPATSPPSSAIWLRRSEILREPDHGRRNPR